MTTAGDRENAIISEARELRDFYLSQGKPSTVRLFAEDFDFLVKRKAIKYSQIGGLDSVIVIRGQRKKRPRKRRPKSSLFQ